MTHPRGWKGECLVGENVHPTLLQGAGLQSLGEIAQLFGGDLARISEKLAAGEGVDEIGQGCIFRVNLLNGRVEADCRRLGVW